MFHQFFFFLKKKGPRGRLVCMALQLLSRILPAGKTTCLVGRLHRENFSRHPRRSRYWSSTNSREEFAQFSHVSTPAKLTSSARWLFSRVHAPWLSEVNARHKFSLFESHSVGADVFAAWVTTEWLRITQGEELIQKGRFGNALVRAPLGVKEESAKVEHGRETMLASGDY